MNMGLQAAETKLQMGDQHGALMIIADEISLSQSPRKIAEFAIRQLNDKKTELAAIIIRMLLQKYPDYYDGLNVLGVILKNNGCHEEAIKLLQKAVGIEPAVDMAWINMGNIYMQIQQPKEALRCFEELLLHHPNHPEGLRLMAAAYTKLQEHDKALECLTLALSYDHNNHLIAVDLCGCYYNQQNYDKALAIVDELINANPQDLNFLRIKGMILRQLKCIPECIALFEKILTIDPYEVKTLVALGNAYHSSLNDSARAKDLYYRAYRINPNDLEISQQLCHLLLAVRGDKNSEDNLDRAVEISYQMLKSSLAVNQVSWVAQGAFLHSLDYDGYDKLGDSKNMMKAWINAGHVAPLILQMSRVKNIEDRLFLLEMHKCWGQKIERAAANNPVARKVRQNLSNKTRVGIFSSYLNNSPVGYFTWPVVTHMDRNKFELYCYSASPYKDHIQQGIMNRADKFTIYDEVSRGSKVAQSMMDDQLDIVFEMGGVTTYNRIEAFAYRVAPVQVSWLGYPHSIGLPTAIDYIVVDPYIKPEDTRLLIEKPFLLPETWVALDEVGFTDFSITSATPEERNGYITFGTLNAGYKFTLEALEAWSNIMKAFPDSKFLCVRPDTRFKVFRDNFYKHMQKYGINSERINFIAADVNHLNCYNYIDISLDTFPHTGGTTTCESLWMGVPVVTLVGEAFFERLSYSNLNNCGLGDLCAFSVAEYQAIAIALAKNKERLRYLRKNLRQQIKQYPLGQPERFVRSFEGVIADILGRG